MARNQNKAHKWGYECDERQKSYNIQKNSKYGKNTFKTADGREKNTFTPQKENKKEIFVDIHSSPPHYSSQTHVHVCSPYIQTQKLHNIFFSPYITWKRREKKYKY